ncbi:hypothetical protein [Kitasatospora sp. NPDC094015]|uniref:hypothetical protein n=1 Tax=Kitasatospora sp. NPDC094015 TaxID=3155205 RepID=UPI00332B8DBC
MGRSTAGRRSAATVWRGLNARQQAFLLAVVEARLPAGDGGWMLFSLDPAPDGPAGATILDGLRVAGWSTRGARSTLRALLERDLVTMQFGLVRLLDGRLAHRTRARALPFGHETAAAARGAAGEEDPFADGRNMCWVLEGFGADDRLHSVVELTRDQFLAIRDVFDLSADEWMIVGDHPLPLAARSRLQQVVASARFEAGVDYFLGARQDFRPAPEPS